MVLAENTEAAYQIYSNRYRKMKVEAHMCPEHVSSESVTRRKCCVGAAPPEAKQTTRCSPQQAGKWCATSCCTHESIQVHSVPSLLLLSRCVYTLIAASTCSPRKEKKVFDAVPHRDRLLCLSQDGPASEITRLPSLTSLTFCDFMHPVIRLSAWSLVWAAGAQSSKQRSSTSAIPKVNCGAAAATSHESWKQCER